ncbi:hypothetical protein LJR034_009034 [Caballeronia sp. LjRoot34]|uniref:hypothetical protein n=1 Tax=Caballeronia sp. LjRoot34 TaxID=3342325 RepID=UPI003ECF51CC
MAQTAGQRQAAYRARRPIAGRQGNGDRRLDMWVSSEVYLALERLARRSGITKRQMLERLVSRKDDAVVRTLDPDTSEWDQYFRAGRSIRSLPGNDGPADGYSGST